MPKIASMRTSVFVSASVYYIPSNGINFFKDDTNYVSLSLNSQGIVYSSEISSSSCYKM